MSAALGPCPWPWAPPKGRAHGYRGQFYGNVTAPEAVTKLVQTYYYEKGTIAATSYTPN